MSRRTIKDPATGEECDVVIDVAVGNSMTSHAVMYRDNVIRWGIAEGALLGRYSLTEPQLNTRQTISVYVEDDGDFRGTTGRLIRHPDGLVVYEISMRARFSISGRLGSQLPNMMNRPK